MYVHWAGEGLRPLDPRTATCRLRRFRPAADAAVAGTRAGWIMAPRRFVSARPLGSDATPPSGPERTGIDHDADSRCYGAVGHVSRATVVSAADPAPWCQWFLPNRPR